MFQEKTNNNTRILVFFFFIQDAVPWQPHEFSFKELFLSLLILILFLIRIQRSYCSMEVCYQLPVLPLDRPVPKHVLSRRGAISFSSSSSLFGAPDPRQLAQVNTNKQKQNLLQTHSFPWCVHIKPFHSDHSCWMDFRVYPVQELTVHLDWCSLCTLELFHIYNLNTGICSFIWWSVYSCVIPGLYFRLF